jgi:predicted GNAT family acetyltransferase
MGCRMVSDSPSTPDTAPVPIHDPQARRFHLQVDGHEAELTYHLQGGTLMVIDHTGVPRPIGGRGLAGVLVQAAFDHARAQGWKVLPACSYADAWARRHAGYADLIEH